MSAKTSSVQLFTGPIQSLVEVTEGVVPGAGTAVAMAVIKTMSIKKDGKFVDINQIGPEDLIAIVRGNRTVETSMTFAMTEGSLLKRLVNAANYGIPTGTVSETHSIFLRLYMNNVVNYLVLKGSRIKSGSIKLAIGKDTEVSVDFVHTGANLPTATPPAGVTLTSTFPSGAVVDWLSGSASPVTWNGAAIKCTEMSIDINRNSSVDHTLGNVDPYSSQPHARSLSGSFMNLWTDAVLETDYDGATARTLVVIISTALTLTLTCTGTKIVTYDTDYDATDTATIVEKLGFTSLAGNIP